MNSNNLLLSYSGTSEQRIQAIFHLLFDESDGIIDIISHTLLNDPSPIVRHEAAYILGEKNSFLAIDPLIRAITTDKAVIVVHESALALANLGSLGYPVSQHLLLDLQQSTNDDLVDTAEIAIQRLNMKMNRESLQFNNESMRDIMDDLSIRNKEKRIQASFLLMEDASTESVEFLIKCLHREPSPIVKHEIIFSLGEAIHYKVVPELIKVLETDTNFFTIHESLLALGTIGDKKSETIIRKFLNDKEVEISESAEIALERLQS